MDRAILLAVLWVTSGAASAAEGLELAAKSRSMAALGALHKASPAPFVAAAQDPVADLFVRSDPAEKPRASRCDASGSDVCYDLAEGRFIYRGARRYMPSFGGLAAESISLRRDRVVLRYTFR